MPDNHATPLRLDIMTIADRQEAFLTRFFISFDSNRIRSIRRDLIEYLPGVLKREFGNRKNFDIFFTMV